MGIIETVNDELKNMLKWNTIYMYMRTYIIYDPLVRLLGENEL